MTPAALDDRSTIRLFDDLTACLNEEVIMDIGIPKQKRPYDYRVGLTPMGVEILTRLGHRCYVESGAGQGSGFDDERYRQAGAQVVYSTEEVYGRGEMILSVSRPAAARVRPAAGRADPLRLPAPGRGAPRKLEILLERRITAIAYETIQNDRRAPARAVAGQPDRRAHGRPDRGPPAAEPRGRARDPARRRAGRARRPMW